MQPDTWQTYDTLCMQLMGLPIPLDIIVTTEDDLDAYKDDWSSVYFPARKEGKEIYAA